VGRDGADGTGRAVDRTAAFAPSSRPRDTQRSRLYRAEVWDGRNLGTLEACRAAAVGIVASDWWRRRFPSHPPARLPRLRPGHGARQAYFGLLEGEATITLPRRYRTRGVLIHELLHWALADAGLAAHGPTFARLLLEATAEFRGPQIAGRLAGRYRRERVRVGGPGRVQTDGVIRYGDDEREQLARRAARAAQRRATIIAMP
jgi:hypothetical protein